jgi:hypothetical protein
MSISPRNHEELFNLRHAMARNVIERIFGVLKRRFRILTVPLEVDLDEQARIPAALAGIHNYIRCNDPDKLENNLSEARDLQLNTQPSTGSLATSHVTTAERNQAEARRNLIAQQMWDQYQEELRRRG